MNRSRRACSVAAMPLVLLAETAALHAEGYEIIDLGTLGGPTSVAWAINNHGQVVGSSTTSSGSLRAFVWQGYLSELTPLAGDSQTQAFAINDSGAVAVMSYSLGAVDTYSLLWEPTLQTDLGAFAARGINAGGSVVGTVNVPVPGVGVCQRAARWQAGSVAQLSTLGGDFSYANAINSAGEVVGMSLLTGNDRWRAAMFRNGSVIDLGTLGGTNSYAFDVNDSGQVVGVSETAGGDSHAFLFSVDAGGGVANRLDLGTLDGVSSHAHAINESGVVVGTSGFRAFKWEAGVMTDLNDFLPVNSAWVLEIAYGINDNGSIVGQGVHYGQSRAFLLAVVEVCTPIDSDQDGDVDLRDFSSFLSEFNGPLVR